MEMLVAGREDSGPDLPSQQQPHLHSQKAKSTAQEPNSTVLGTLWVESSLPAFTLHCHSANTTAGPELTLTRTPTTTGTTHPVGRKEAGVTGNQWTVIPWMLLSWCK